MESNYVGRLIDLTMESAVWRNAQEQIYPRSHGDVEQYVWEPIQDNVGGTAESAAREFVASMVH